MNKICKTFHECSNDILNWLSKQPEVKEESMTDRFLFEISEKLPYIVKYKQFNRIEEGRKTGADWEWWILLPNNQAFCSRVQAKKLKSDKDNYAGIAYTTNGILQIERLIDDCTKENFASLYAFYTTESSKYSMCGGKMNDKEGVFLSDALQLREEIINKPRSSYLAKDILKYSNPISCLFCCPLSHENNMDDFYQYFRQYFPRIYSKRANENSDKPQGFVTIPERILNFINGELEKPWEIQYESSIQNVNALLVIDLRNSK